MGECNVIIVIMIFVLWWFLLRALSRCLRLQHVLCACAQVLAAVMEFLITGSVHLDHLGLDVRPIPDFIKNHSSVFRLILGGELHGAKCTVGSNNPWFVPGVMWSNAESH